jgi:5-methylcytosine-specific restriction endonuclease McrA
MGKLTSIERKVATLDLRRGGPVAVKRIRGGRLDKIRQRVMLRDLYTCRMCGRVTAHGEVDHVTPLGDGGQETDANRQYLCRDCHHKKTELEMIEKGLMRE